MVKGLSQQSRTCFWWHGLERPVRLTQKFHIVEKHMVSQECLEAGQHSYIIYIPSTTQKWVVSRPFLKMCFPSNDSPGAGGAGLF